MESHKVQKKTSLPWPTLVVCALQSYHLWWGVASSFLWLVFLSHAAAIVQLATHRAWSEKGPDVIMSPFFVFRCVVQHPDQVEDCPACRIAKYIVLSSYWYHLSMLATHVHPLDAILPHIPRQPPSLSIPSTFPSISLVQGFWFWQYKSEQLAVRVTWESRVRSSLWRCRWIHAYWESLNIFKAPEREMFLGRATRMSKYLPCLGECLGIYHIYHINHIIPVLHRWDVDNPASTNVFQCFPALPSAKKRHHFWISDRFFLLFGSHVFIETSQTPPLYRMLETIFRIQKTQKFPSLRLDR